MITSAAERARTAPYPLAQRRSFASSKAFLVGLAAIGVVAVGVFLGKRLVIPAADAQAAATEVRPAIPTTHDAGVAPPEDGGVDIVPEGARYLSVETIPDDSEDPGGTRDRTRRPRKTTELRTTAAKLTFLESCKQRCAASVLDKYRRFATLSVDEARGLGAELDSCVKHCGG